MPARPRSLPRLIQGGMGVAVSNWRLARAVAAAGHLGVVSGTALDTVLVRRLQDGDPGGEVRRALAAFPEQAIVNRVLYRFFIPGGKKPNAPYRRLAMHTHRNTAESQDVCTLAAFAEVWLARNGHHGEVGINLLTKVQIPTIPTLYGAMLAGVDYVIMGAGIPREIPGILDALAEGLAAELTLDVNGDNPTGKVVRIAFDPLRFGAKPPARPKFFAIVASHTLATMLSRKASGSVDGFIVEGPVAGGHNAPPRGTPVFDDLGQPLYGPRDEVDLSVMRVLPQPFWLAGGMDSPDRLQYALDEGASGIQVGTLFAFCRESGVDPALRRRLLDGVEAGTTQVFTDPRASSTGYPFKVAQLDGTVSQREVYENRTRVCDLGYLREAYFKKDGGIGYRCAAEPVETYIGKGGTLLDTEQRKCLCNGLTATVGLGQVQKNGQNEPPIVTSGESLDGVRQLLDISPDYTAIDVIDFLLAEVRSDTYRWATA